jgi:hypothetical protein
MGDFSLTIAGVEKDIRVGSLRVTYRANGRSVMECSVLSEDGTYRPAAYAEAILFEDSTAVFGGLIESPDESGTDGQPTESIDTRVNAVDFNAYIDRRIVNVSIPGGTLKAALQALEPYLTSYGVSLDVAQVNGPTLDALAFSYQPLRAAFDQLSTLTGYVYEIDANKVLRMYDPGTLSAPFNITTNETVGDVQVQAPRDEYYNKVILTFGSGLQDATASFTGDGGTQTFPLPYVPAARPTTVTVDGTDYPVGVNGVDVMEWTYDAATNALIQTGAPVGLGLAINSTFSAQFPGVATAENAGEIAGQGLVERKVDVPGVFNAGIALALASAHLGRGIRRPRRVTYTTLLSGLMPGQTQTITIADRNLAGTWMIEEVVLSEFEGVISYRVTAVEGSAPVSTWSELYQQWSGATTTPAAATTTQAAGGLSGTGTIGSLAKWATASSLTDSVITDSGTAADVMGELHPWEDVIPNAGYDVNLGTLPKKYLALHAAELWVETLVAQNTLATIGGRVLIGTTNILAVDAGAGATTLSFKYNNLANGDVIYFEANGAVEFMAVTSAPSGAGPYDYTVTRNLDGSGANAWSAGDAAFNTGQMGDGFIDLYSVRGVKAASEYGPTIVGNIRASGTYNDWSPRWAIGNLNGLYGYVADTYGAAFGVPTAAWVKIDPTNGIRIGHNVTTKISIDAVGNASFSGAITAASGTIGSFTIGTYLYTGTKTAFDDANTGVHVGSDGIGIKGASGTCTISAAGVLTAGNAVLTGSLSSGAGAVTIDANGIYITAGVGNANLIRWSSGAYISGVDGSVIIHSTASSNTVFLDAGGSTVRFTSSKEFYCTGGGGSLGTAGANWTSLYLSGNIEACAGLSTYSFPSTSGGGTGGVLIRGNDGWTRYSDFGATSDAITGGGVTFHFKNGLFTGAT